MTQTIQGNDIGAEARRVFDLQKARVYEIGRTTAAQRIEKLDKISGYVNLHFGEIEDALFRDFSKSPSETALTEIYSLNTEIKFTSNHLRRWMRPKRVSASLAALGSTSLIATEPKGVSLIIAPWNYPFLLMMRPLVSALAAGCTAILKPSEYTVHTSAFIKNMIGELFTEDDVAVFEGDYRVSQALLDLPFDHIYFTGSPAVGKIVMGAAAKNLSSVTLELGGKSPVIIEASADLAEAARKIVWGKLINGGQTCVAPDYCLIAKDRVEEFVVQLEKYIEKSYGPLASIEANGDFCRIVNARNFGRIKGLVDTAVASGATIAVGGQVNEATNFIAPTVVLNAPLTCELMHEEIFGPVLPIIAYDTLEEAFGIVRSLPKPLALYIFSHDEDAADRIVRETRAGDTVVNDVIVHLANTNLPFGGCNNSGIGKSNGSFGFEEFSHKRSLMKQPKRTLIQLFYPPYTPRLKKIIEFMAKYIH